MSNSVFHMFRFSWRHPIEAIKDFLRIIRYSYQRITKGYCDYDVGDIDIWFEMIMPNMLRRLKSVQSGCPVEMFDEYYELHCDDLKVSEKEFAYELQTNNELRQKVDDWSYSRWQYKNKALALFEKYYYCLWN